MLLAWFFAVHIVGIYLFTRGFLLSRLSLPDYSLHNSTLTPTHNRVVLLIIDALRFDFVSPDPPRPASPNHHNVLNLPRQLTEKQPTRSFLFNAYADPPTTTLQRIKGLTTGSLPTFVDMGNNFGGSSIMEDSILKQMKLAEKTVRLTFIYLFDKHLTEFLRQVGFHGRRYVDVCFSRRIPSKHDIPIRLFQCRRPSHRRPRCYNTPLPATGRPTQAFRLSDRSLSGRRPCRS